MSATSVIALLLTITTGRGGVATPEHARSATDSGGPRARPAVEGALAQEAGPVTLILKEDFSRPGLAAVVRATSAGMTIIGFKRSSLTPELLSAALSSLSSARRKRAERPDGDIDVHIPDKMKLRQVAPSERAELERIIAQLRAAPRRRIPGIGEVPAITVRL